MTQELEFLNDLIDKGVEYPDAVWRTTEHFGLDVGDVMALEAAYDTQWS